LAPDCCYVFGFINQAILLMGQGGPKYKPGQKIYDDLQLDDAENDQTTNP